MREVTLPALERGFAKAGKQRADFEISGPMFVVTGTNDEEIERAMRGTKQQIAFYGSTPAYRGVLELHGWGDLQDELNRLSKQGEWVEMGELIDDDDPRHVRGGGRSRGRAEGDDGALRRHDRSCAALPSVPERSGSVEAGPRRLPHLRRTW